VIVARDGVPIVTEKNNELRSEARSRYLEPCCSLRT
jgi:hypothetical protein